MPGAFLSAPTDNNKQAIVGGGVPDALRSTGIEIPVKRTVKQQHPVGEGLDPPTT